MEEEDSLHVVPAPIGKKRIPASVQTQAPISHGYISGGRTMVNGWVYFCIESMQCM
jgi:hypothetical protein